MLRIRIVSAGLAAAIAVLLAASGAPAQTATNDTTSPAPLAGLPPPHATRTYAHETTVGRTHKKMAARKPRVKVAHRKHHELVAAPVAEPPAPPAPEAAPVSDVSLPDAMPPAGVVDPLPQAVPDDPPQMVVGGQTVQIVSPDQVNAIDRAADDKRDAAPAHAQQTDPAPVQTVLAAPVHSETNHVGSASWIAQVLAALGGAVAAGGVAWFLIGSGPVRTYS